MARSQTAMKFCKKCEETKSLTEFGPNRSRSDGVQLYCRPCWKNYTRPYFLMTKFGIDGIEYDRLFEQQGGVCPICGEKPQKNMFPVDHDHATGVVRGILCIRCNMNLEWFIDHRVGVETYLEGAMAV